MDPLNALQIAIRFAARDGFAGAANVRDLGRLVAHHLPAARAAGMDEGALEELVAAAAAFDAASGAGREAAVRRLAGALGRLVPISPDLRAIAGSSAQALPEEPRSQRQPTHSDERRGQRQAPHPDEPRAQRLPTHTEAPRAQRLPTHTEEPRAQRQPLPPEEPQTQHAPLAPEDRRTQAPPPSPPVFRLESPTARRPAASGEKKPASRATRAAKAPASKPDDTDAAPSRIVVPAVARAHLERPLSDFPGVGPKMAQLLAKRGLTQVGHVIFHLPRGYQDRRGAVAIRDLLPGQKGLTLGEVVESREIFNPRSRKKMLRVVIQDRTSRLALTFFHYWPSMMSRFETGRRFFAWGEVKLFGGQKQIVHPEVEEVDDASADDASLNIGRIVPFYRGMDEVGQVRYRALVQRVLADHLEAVPEILPESLRRSRNLPEVRQALFDVHFPGPSSDAAALSAGASPGHRRLAYEELLLLSVGLALKARGVEVEPGQVFDTSDERIEKALSVLPFTPTGAQRRAIAEIAADMAQTAPMNRLIQGDVGSGKTAVALVACLLAVFDGRQAALMAPTEILAEQHHRNFENLLAGSGIEVSLLASGRGQKLLGQARRRTVSGEARIAVGTHALSSEGSLFENLGLVVIDEQHRFGVEQRADLIGKGKRPDVLVMTATPIPRTLSLVLHGEMTQTVIDELPPGRTPVQTKVFSSGQREKVYAVLEKQMDQGRQAYVVYPLIEESERSDLEDATRGLTVLQERFPGRRLALLHGRMKAEERDAVMAAFRAHEVDLLVSTTVVEVGVDVPNASVMVIEHAERFGLSQLHQLRGRVGRGAAKSYCFLVDHAGREGRAKARLSIMEETTDGFRIAQADLEIRGPGEFLGTRQAGLPDLQFADLSRDAGLLEEARADAFAWVRADPELAAAPLLKTEVFERFAERMSLARVG